MKLNYISISGTSVIFVMIQSTSTFLVSLVAATLANLLFNFL